MYKVLQATYENGNLILKEKLSSEMEGKTLKVIIVETNELEAKKERFFSLLDRHSFALPANYQFDREELHADKMMIDTNLWVYLYAKNPQ